MEIRVRDLGKSFGVSPTLHGINIDIASGELLGLLGPSGSGKTTLLRTIAGLETPTKGEIFFGDEEASTKSVQDRRVGFVFQSYALFKHMTVAQNIAYGLRIRPRADRPSSSEIDRRVVDLLDMMQLVGFGDRYPSQLSGGQRQRVALARALAVEPRVLLLDEPFGALDAQVRKDLRSWLREIHDRTGHTTVFVTHDQDEALELSDRVAILNRGRIEQVGTPDDVYDNPQTPFVFGFIGESNQLPVHIQSGRIVLNGQALDLPPVPVADGPAVTFFRPQHAELAQAESQGLAGTLKEIHRVGPQVRARVKLEGLATLVDAHLPLGVPLKAGERISLRITESRTFATDDSPN
jgi:sulfate transport system ATP-binding protein